MARVINVDAARAARQSKRDDDDPVVVIIGGERFKLPAELPLEVLSAFGEMARTRDASMIQAGLTELLGDKAYEAGRPWSLDDAMEVLESALDAYGIEADPSTASSTQ